MTAISRLLAPRSVAVIGASADATKTSGRPIFYLRKHGFTGDIYPVNPRVESIDGLRCYPDIQSLPRAPDVALVLLSAARAHLAVAELAAIGTPAAIVVASGYSETGADGARRQAELVAAAGSMRLLGPNTIGLVNVTDRIPLSVSGALEMDQFPEGVIGVVSQSGGILGSLLSRAAARGLGLSKLISTSNEADLDLADLVDYFADDPSTRVIALYIESIRNPDRFRAAALKAHTMGKPVVAFKIGRSEAGAKAAVSHTGALAGSDRMYDALFNQLGVIRAHAFADLLDIPAALATRRTLRGKRIAILTSTGGAGTLVADSLGIAGFETPPPDAATAARLRALQPGDHAALDRNPIDVTLAGLQPDVLRGAIAAVLESPTYDALTIIVGSSGVANPELMAGAVQASLPGSDKPVLAYISPHAPQAAALLTAYGVPAFTAPESCASALSAMSSSAISSSTMSSSTMWRATPATPKALAAPADLPIGSLDEVQAKALFAHFGIPSARELIVTNAAEAERAARELGGRVALKILSREITHKSDVGGVAIDLTPDTIGARLATMATDVATKTGTQPRHYLVQEMISGGTELILGFHRDPLGRAILLGFGGVTAELFQDTALCLLPAHGGLSREAARALAQDLKAWPLLDGFRGRPKADVEALVSAIVAFSEMAAALGRSLDRGRDQSVVRAPAWPRCARRGRHRYTRRVTPRTATSKTKLGCTTLAYQKRFTMTFASWALSAFLAAAVGIPGMARAQSAYPERDVRVLIGFTAGGTTDVIARIIGQELAERWGRAIVIDNRPGAGGNIATDMVAKAKPDGYTLMIGSVGPLAVNATLYKDLPYDNLKDLTPITLVAHTPNMLVVNAKESPTSTLKEFIDSAKAKPGSIFYGSTGSGTMSHLVGEMLNQQAGIQLVHVPYKGATGVTDLLSGQSIGAMFATIPSVIAHVRAGRLRAIAVTTLNRSQSSSDVPTIAELGFPGFDGSSWFGIVGPAGLPRAIVDKWQAEVARILQKPEVRERFVSMGADPVGGTPEEFAAYIRSETTKWGALVRANNIKAD